MADFLLVREAFSFLLLSVANGLSFPTTSFSADIETVVGVARLMFKVNAVSY